MFAQDHRTTRPPRDTGIPYLHDNQFIYILNRSYRQKGFPLTTILAVLPPKPYLNPGRFGPIPVWSGRFGSGSFGPISGLSCFGPTGAGRFGPVSKVGRFGPI